MSSDSATSSAELHAGRLLVAAPSLLDPNFARSVVLLCEVNQDGALGLMLNRPSESPVADFLPQWPSDPPAVVFVGGPVQPEIAVGLGQHHGEEPVGFSEIIDDVGLFDLATPVELVADALSHLRVFSGYAGWGVGQLEAELMTDDWIAVEAVDGDVFTRQPNELWSEVLRRQGGELAFLADYPPDPTLN